MKIYTFPNNPRAYKALVTAAYVGVDIEVLPVEMGKTNKTQEFLQLNPWGKVPTLETDDGQGIWESNAIARYIARLSDNTLFGDSPVEYGQVEQWIDWVRGDLELASSVWLYPIYGLIPNNPIATEKAKEDIQKCMRVLNQYMDDRSYLVGERVTLADIVVACSLIPLYTKVFDENFRQGFPNVTRWFVNMVRQPNFLQVVQDINLCENMEVAGQSPESANEPVEEEEEAAVEESNDAADENAPEAPIEAEAEEKVEEEAKAEEAQTEDVQTEEVQAEEAEVEGANQADQS